MTAAEKPTRRVYRCGACGRKLPHERWVYSRHTGSRYCWPGEGCQKPRRARVTGPSSRHDGTPYVQFTGPTEAAAEYAAAHPALNVEAISDTYRAGREHAPMPPALDVEYADEEDTGQLALGVPGEQRSIPTLAAPGIPAPVEEV